MKTFDSKTIRLNCISHNHNVCSFVFASAKGLRTCIMQIFVAPLAFIVVS